jgi:single-stranded-DNA-specific exonuclease
VFWWRSADEPLPEGRFDLAYTVSAGTYRDVPEVQLSWVAVRSIGPVIVHVPERAAIKVLDYRNLPEPLPPLRALAERPDASVVWSEGVGGLVVEARDRHSLSQAETLIIWTVPPDPVVLDDALQAVEPKRVVLFGVDPGLDALPAFLSRLAGLVKHVLRARGGQVEVAELAAAMAHSEYAVRLGLSWMAEKGQIQVVFDRRGWAAVWEKRERPGDQLHVVEGQLKAQLEETAAYRSFFLAANAQRLINER